MKNRQKNTLYFLATLLGLLVVCNLYMFFFSNPSTSKSIFNKYNEYHSLLDWNLPHAVELDINEDGQADLLQSDGCLYITTELPVENEDNCPAKESMSSSAIFSEDLLFSKNTVAHAFVTKDTNWKLYIRKNLSTTVLEIDNSGNVKQTKPSTTEKIDTAWYFLTHLFSVLI